MAEVTNQQTGTAIEVWKKMKTDQIEQVAELFGEAGKPQKPATNAFFISVLSVLKNSTLLQKATPESIRHAVFTAASLRLPISDNLGYAYIVPYVNGKTKQVEAQFQIGYRGLIQLAIRSGKFKTITVREVYEGQMIGYDEDTGEPKFDWNAKHGDKIIGYRAYFELIDGFRAQLFMTIEEIQAHAQRYSASYKKFLQYQKKGWNAQSLWADDFDKMARKTVLKLLLARFAPLTIEMQTAIIRDQSTGEEQYPDNPKMTLEEANRQREGERLRKWIKEADTIEKLEMAEQAVKEFGDEDLQKEYDEKAKMLKEAQDGKTEKASKTKATK